jgi:hypothetical protein
VVVDGWWVQAATKRAVSRIAWRVMAGGKRTRRKYRA